MVFLLQISRVAPIIKMMYIRENPTLFSYMITDLKYAILWSCHWYDDCSLL